MNKITLLVALIFGWSLSAQTSADTTFINTEQIQLDWFNDFDETVEFPDEDQTYSQIIMTLKLGQYNCEPGADYCHQWDYNTHIQLVIDDEVYEMGRFITPFATSGWSRFGSDWEQPYTFDVTDFYPLLKGAQTVRIHYGGYSGGFTAELEFAFIEGTPDREVLGVKPVYQFSKPYGNPDEPINESIETFTDTPPEGTVEAMMQVLVTGHGSDGTEQCCEFSSHFYDVLVNQEEIAHTEMWKDDCGENNLYPQGGTWIYDRANWCPGEKVQPFYHAFEVEPETPYDLKVEFEEYTGSGEYGSYNYGAVIFYYGETNKEIDVALTDIVTPTNNPDHFRANPSNDEPVVKVKNTGSTEVTSIDFSYGVIGYGQETHSWSGSLAAGEETTIHMTVLDALKDLAIEDIEELQTFEIEITAVNGEDDEDLTNNYRSTQFDPAPHWPGEFVIDLKVGSKMSGSFLSNTGASDISWKIYDNEGNEVIAKTDLESDTDYLDTIQLPTTDFYKFEIKNENCYGLHWWPFDQSPAYVAGSLKIKGLNGAIIPLKNYKHTGTEHDDWGCVYTQYFVGDVDLQGVEEAQPTKFTVYPNPAKEVIHIEMSGNLVPPYQVDLVNIQGRSVYHQESKEAALQVSVDQFPEGLYMLVFKDQQNQRHIEKVIIGK